MEKIGTTYCVQAVAMANETRAVRASGRVEGQQRDNTLTSTRPGNSSFGPGVWRLLRCGMPTLTLISPSLQSYHFPLPPLISEPPSACLPDPEANGSWYGDIWITYPLTEDNQSQLKAAHTFKARSEFAI